MTYSQSEPLVTGALLSGMLHSMNDLGGMGSRLLSKYGVDHIQLDEWYMYIFTCMPSNVRLDVCVFIFNYLYLDL